MSYSIIAESRFWFICVMTGFMLTFIYDIFILFRSIIRHIRIFRDIEDIIYWMICFCISFKVLYYENNGIIRLSSIIGAICGLLVYRLTIGRFFVKLMLWVYQHTIGKILQLFIKISYGLHKNVKYVNNKFTKLFRQYGKIVINLKYLLTQAILKRKIK